MNRIGRLAHEPGTAAAVTVVVVTVTGGRSPIEAGE